MAKTTVYKKENFEGESFDFTGSVSDFTPFGFNDQIGSAKVEGGTWQAYGNTNYDGTSATLSSNGGNNGDGCYANANEMGGLTGISSIRLNNED